MCGEGEAPVSWGGPGFAGGRGCGYLLQTLPARQSGSAAAFLQHWQECQNTLLLTSDRFLKIYYLDWGFANRAGSIWTLPTQTEALLPHLMTDNPAFCSPKWVRWQALKRCLDTPAFCPARKMPVAVLSNQLGCYLCSVHSSAASVPWEGSAASTQWRCKQDVCSEAASHWLILCVRCFLNELRFLSSSACCIEIKEGLMQALFQSPLPPCQTHTLSTKSLNHALFPELQDGELHIGPLWLHSATLFWTRCWRHLSFFYSLPSPPPQI